MEMPPASQLAHPSLAGMAAGALGQLCILLLQLLQLGLHLLAVTQRRQAAWRGWDRGCRCAARRRHLPLLRRLLGLLPAPLPAVQLVQRGGLALWQGSQWAGW